MKIAGKYILAGAVGLIIATLCGCWLTYDNPNAPDVVPPIGKPDNWPVFRGTNQPPTNVVAKCQGKLFVVSQTLICDECGEVLICDGKGKVLTGYQRAVALPPNKK